MPLKGCCTPRKSMKISSNVSYRHRAMIIWANASKSVWVPKISLYPNENGMKRLFSRKPWMSASLSQRSGPEGVLWVGGCFHFHST
ncbi:hypothetical protein EJB05_55301, partial [Eragrostis curvula]